MNTIAKRMKTYTDTHPSDSADQDYRLNDDYE